MIEGTTGMKEAIGGLATSSTAYLGPKPWAEISDSEKIERLRNELEGWRRVCAELRERLQLFETHTHGDNGKLLVSLEQADRQRSMNQCSSAFNTLR